VKADLKTKRILRSTTTPANVHDSQVFEALLDDKGFKTSHAAQPPEQPSLQDGALRVN
jgi:hypothetical protein